MNRYQEEYNRKKMSARQVLENIVAVLAEGGAGPQHLERLTWYVTDKHEYLGALRDVGAVRRRVGLAASPPAA